MPLDHDAVYQVVPGTLLHLLTNSLVLSHVVAHLPVSALLQLAATSHAYHALVHSTAASGFRHLDLSTVRAAQFEVAAIDRGGETWRNVQVDENLTEDEFYSGPLRGIFASLARRDWLASVRTLVLDRTSVPASLVHDLLTQPQYNIRVLSLRDATHLNESQLQRVLQSLCRPNRPAGTPKLRGLYIFGDSDPAATKSDVAGDVWYHRHGGIASRRNTQSVFQLHRPVDPVMAQWANTLMDCRGVLAFDAVLCNGPRHFNSPAFGQLVLVPGAASAPFAVATRSLTGCAGCGSAPEGWTAWGDDHHRHPNHVSYKACASSASASGGISSSGTSSSSSPSSSRSYISRYPLLWPPPRMSSSLRVAMCPDGAAVRPWRYGWGVGNSSNGGVRAPVRRDSSSSSFSCSSSERGSDGESDIEVDMYRQQQQQQDMFYEDLQQQQPVGFIARCNGCVKDRLCHACHRWWCESCMPLTQDPATSAMPHDDASSTARAAASFKVRAGRCAECAPVGG